MRACLYRSSFCHPLPESMGLSMLSQSVSHVKHISNATHCHRLFFLLLCRVQKEAKHHLTTRAVLAFFKVYFSLCKRLVVLFGFVWLVVEFVLIRFPLALCLFCERSCSLGLDPSSYFIYFFTPDIWLRYPSACPSLWWVGIIFLPPRHPEIPATGQSCSDAY